MHKILKCASVKLRRAGWWVVHKRGGCTAHPRSHRRDLTSSHLKIHFLFGSFERTVIIIRGSVFLYLKSNFCLFILCFISRISYEISSLPGHEMMIQKGFLKRPDTLHFTHADVYCILHPTSYNLNMLYAKSFMSSYIRTFTSVLTSSEEDAVERGCLWGARQNHKMLLKFLMSRTQSGDTF